MEVGQEYVAGFMFGEKSNRLLLIEKQKPEWQAGKFNAIGGKIESGEKPLAAMIREFKEEVGIDHEDWVNFCVLEGEPKGNGCVVPWRVYFYKAKGMIDEAQQCEAERPYIVHPQALPANCLPNLSWLVPLAMSEDSVFLSGCEGMAI